MKSSSSRTGDDTTAGKDVLRQTMRRLRCAIARDQAREAARQAAANLLQLAEIATIKTVGMYEAMGGELSTHEAAAALRSRGIALAYPRVLADQRTLGFHRIGDPAELASGTFGILEPSAAAEPVALSAIDLFVIPGLAFERRGHRLGWGKGCYDATLAASPALRVGYAYNCQIVANVPCGEHDLLMDIVVTEVGIVHTGARAYPLAALALD